GLFSEALEAEVVKDLPVPVLLALMFGPLCNVCRDAILGFLQLNDQLVDSCVEACWDAVRK
ncbi:MAG TPA: TetR/AcrR family transcriptional regulator, partial [Verrucomicrobiae bacterium]|nr:TetR/AcrR family transcriptional regulator [Verrucomicrobiae bacterium]